MIKVQNQKKVMIIEYDKKYPPRNQNCRAFRSEEQASIFVFLQLRSQTDGVKFVEDFRRYKEKFIHIDCLLF